MKDEEFNRYCAEVMGYTWDVWASSILLENNDTWEGYKDKDGYAVDVCAATDLNQMAEVFDKLWLNYYDEYSTSPSLNMGDTRGIAKAMRDFIESTNEK